MRYGEEREVVEQRVAVVTAGGRGMGGAIARALAARDYALVLMSPGGSAEALAEELGGIGVKLLHRP